MQTDERDGDGAPPNMATVRVLRVPLPPSVARVRFLGELDGTLTHWVRETVPCPGSTCRHCRNHVPREYRGYVAAEVRDSKRKAWVPTVVEVTERLYWSLAGTTLRGTVWDLYRESTGRNKTTCMGTLIAEVDPKTLPLRFSVLPVVSRLFRNLPVLWGHVPELAEPMQLPMSVDPDVVSTVEQEERVADLVIAANPREPGEKLGDYAARIAAIRQQQKGGRP